MKQTVRTLAGHILALILATGCADSHPQVVQILEVSTLDYYGDLGVEAKCSNTADRPYFYTLRIEFTDGNGVVKEVQEPYLLIGGGETDDLGYTSSHSGVTKVRCSIKNCSPQ
jgi:hypothetical protein